MPQTFSGDHRPTLLTLRLELRALVLNDHDDLFAIYGDPKVMQFTSDPTFPDGTYINQLFVSVERLFAEQQALLWGVALRDTGRIVGTCELHSFEPDDRRAEIGCMLARAYWGRSLMREALTAVIEFGVGNLGLATLRADIDVPNAQSRALFQRLGFQSVVGSPTLFELQA